MRLHHACLALLPLATTASAALTVDFSTITSIPDHFAGNGQTLPTWGGAAGLGGGGGIDIDPANYLNFQAIAQSGGEAFGVSTITATTSLYFRINSAPTNNPSDARLLDLYVVEATGTNMTATGAGNAHVGVRLNTTGNNTTYLFQVRNNNATVSGTNSAPFSINLGNWYQMSVSVTPLDATNVTVTAQLVDRGLDGTGDTPAGVSYSQVVANATLATDPLVFGGLRIPRGDNLSAADNFSFTAIPEPSAFGALAAGLGALVLFLRRRR